MRVVFAGTPEVGAAGARRAVAASGTSWSGVVTRPDAPAGRGRTWSPRPVAQLAERLGVPVLKPTHPKDPGFQAELARAGPRLLPGRRLRRPAAAERARHPRARLGQPALLAAARVARRRAGAARALGRRRGHRRHHVPDRPGAGRRPDVRRDDRDGAAHRHRRRPARRGSPRAAPSCWSRTLDGIADGAAGGPRAARRGRQPAPRRSTSTTPASTGPSRPSPSTAGSGRAPRRRAPGPPSRASG